MKAKLAHIILITATLAAWVFGVGGCSTSEVNPNPAPTALPPPYVQVPHPAGFDMSDLRAIFTEYNAPKLEDLKGCDDHLKKLKSLTNSPDELTAGMRELVKTDPVRYHWCYYGKLLELEADLKTDAFIDEKQKKVLEAYAFLTPIGRAFMQEYHDSRYLRWAVRHYRLLSEWVFYRKVEMTPQMTAELVEATNPFGLLREPAAPRPVLEKYNIVKPNPKPPAALTAPMPPPPESQAAVPASPAEPSPQNPDTFQATDPANAQAAQDAALTPAPPPEAQAFDPSAPSPQSGDPPPADRAPAEAPAPTTSQDSAAIDAILNGGAQSAAAPAGK